MELKYIVYVTVNLCNGKLYFGVHKTNPDVFDGYIGNSIYRPSNANGHYPFHKAVRKYGYENFRRTIIQIFPDTEEGEQAAFKLESEIVNKTLLKSKNIYNVHIGGKGGYSETKPIYQFTLKGKYIKKYDSIREAANNINPNNIFNTIKSIRNNCLGRSQSSNGYCWSYTKKFNYNNSKKKPIAQYTISGKFIRYYNSITEAEIELQLTSIKQAITKGWLCGEYQWKYYNNDDSDIKSYYSNNCKNNITPIIMFDKNNNYIKEYNSINECALENNLSSSQINRVLKKIIHTHKGYIFKYKDKDIV